MHGLQHFQQRLRGNRNPPHVHACSVRNRVRNRRSSSVQRQLTNALRTRRSAAIRKFLEANANRRKIRRSRHHVIRHLRVHHAPFLPHHVFVQRESHPLRHAAFNLPGG